MKKQKRVGQKEINEKKRRKKGCEKEGIYLFFINLVSYLMPKY